MFPVTKYYTVYVAGDLKQRLALNTYIFHELYSQ